MLKKFMINLKHCYAILSAIDAEENWRLPHFCVTLGHSVSLNLLGMSTHLSEGTGHLFCSGFVAIAFPGFRVAMSAICCNFILVLKWPLY